MVTSSYICELTNQLKNRVMMGKGGRITPPDPHPFLKQAYGQIFGDNVALLFSF
jgi:hypothetical protein